MADPLRSDAPRPRLGRGLAALIGDVGDETAAIERSRGARRVPIEFLRANPKNPRKTFAEQDLDDLANSIREKGVIQPILARAVPGQADAYEIIAGERRWRAAQKAGLHDVPMLLLEVGDREAMEIAIVENVQRSDLNPIEEAAGYDRLGAEFGYTQQDLARVIGKSRSHVANMLRLLKLPSPVLDSVSRGDLSAGHARALLAVADPDAVARQIVQDQLTVRDVERIAQREAAQPEAPKAKSAAKARAKDADTLALEQRLSDRLGLVVRIEHGRAGGEVRIRYRTLEQLDGVIGRLDPG